MQRIDDATYIDDSLITCSEYQLFIYEARTQGAYYHLDHWRSHEFQKGRAREPVLGVRFHDAESFCKWLAYRDGGNWNYRLPYTTEIDNFPIHSGMLRYWGYWTLSIDEKPEFVWVSEVPADARKIDIEKTLKYLKVQNSFLVRSRSRSIIQAYKKLHNQPLDIELAKRKINDQSIMVAIDKYISSVRNRNAQNSENVLDHVLSLAIESNLETFVDFLTLQERIAGRSPAFEGIRLVKERIR